MSKVNDNRYRISERLARKFDISYDALDNNTSYTDSEIDALVEAIVSSKEKFTIKPFDNVIVPLGSNGDGTMKLFSRRKYYRDYALPDTTKNLNELEGETVDDTSNFQGTSRNIISPFETIDLMHRKAFYGRIDTNNRSIYPSEKFLKLMNGTENVMLLNFVADAANDLREKIRRMVDSKKMPERSVYAEFKAAKGWTSFTKLHHDSMQKIFEGFITRYANSPKFFTKITDFKSYVTHVTSFLDVFLPAYPITRSNMQLHSTTNPSISGLIFELSQDNHDEDENKYRKYIMDPNFVSVCKLANAFGFYVDKNAPWRFIADLESPQMRKRMLDKGFDTLQEMFSAYYYDSHLYEVNTLRDYFLSFYDSYVEAYPYCNVVEDCNGTSKAKLLYRQRRNKNPFSDKKLVEFYFYIRAKEANLHLTQQEFDLLVQEANQIFKDYGFIESLHFINDKTTTIFGLGENYGMKIENSEKGRIFQSRVSYSNSNRFKFKL